jgi:catechol 2,3-dioxygenase-like lactoylglutathione lyase family enzyme
MTTDWANQIETVTLFVDDLPAARTFYLEVFGRPVHFEDPESAVFKFGSLLINLLDAKAAGELVDPAAVGQAKAFVTAVLTIPVEDVDAVVEQVQARGVAILNGPVDRPWGVRTASFRDPGGHVWEVAGPLRPGSSR